MCPVNLLNYAKKSEARHAIGLRSAQLRPRARDTAEESELTGRCLRVPPPSPAVPRPSLRGVCSGVHLSDADGGQTARWVRVSAPTCGRFLVLFSGPVSDPPPLPPTTTAVIYRWEGSFGFFKWRQLWSDRRQVSFLVRKASFFQPQRRLSDSEVFLLFTPEGFIFPLVCADKQVTQCAAG